MKGTCITGKNDQAMTAKMITEFTVIKNTNKVTNEQMLLWAEQKEVQRSLEAVLRQPKR